MNKFWYHAFSFLLFVSCLGVAIYTAQRLTAPCPDCPRGKLRPPAWAGREEGRALTFLMSDMPVEPKDRSDADLERLLEISKRPDCGAARASALYSAADTAKPRSPEWRFRVLDTARPLLADPNPYLRAAAVTAMADLGDLSGAQERLRDHDPNVVISARNALQEARK